MSAVAGSESSKCEPNMTPLLDMVLQLIMFFMLCAHFVTEQVDLSIKLPQAIEAKALDGTVVNYTILNIESSGVTTTLTARGEERWETPTQVQNNMKIQFDLDKARTKPADWEKGKGRTLVILRASKDCYYKQVHDVWRACQRAGYTDVQLRVLKVEADQR
ncbi:MAG TPA: biopolymer transporter ExbD [Fimbriiglobus sp.]|jgi:biopolymer transport protein ExbD|nr:biopolymer transporter ExbD [Fimbriiglobus sp.]